MTHIQTAKSPRTKYDLDLISLPVDSYGIWEIGTTWLEYQYALSR
jgi:hypothetical protein